MLSFEPAVIFAESKATLPKAIECDHIIGFHLAAYPQYGEIDRLIRVSEKIEPNEPFNYCPLCGGLFVVPAFTTRIYKS